jgi:hypothetical protein
MMRNGESLKRRLKDVFFSLVNDEPWMKVFLCGGLT